MNRRVYADHAATTRPAAAVVAAMRPWLEEGYGNPSSVHARGVAARDAVEEARARVAGLIGAAPSEIVFTASGSEANSLALCGVLAGRGAPRNELAISAVEHASVFETARHLEALGHPLHLLPVDETGRLRPEALAGIGPRTALVSVQAANHETGAVQPLAAVVAAAREAGALVHVDAVQAAGKIPLDVAALDVDLLSLAGHKLQGPPGAAALFVRRRLRLIPLIHGGSQERGRRAGTENVPAVVGFGVAAEIAGRDLVARAARLERHGRRLLDGLRAIPGLRLNGPEVGRLPGIVNVEFPGVDGEGLLHELDAAGIAVSTGSACSAASPGPSRILLAMGRDAATAHASVRFSLGPDQEDADIDAILEAVPAALERLLALGGGKARGHATSDGA